jgi:hypothetical protein
MKPFYQLSILKKETRKYILFTWLLVLFSGIAYLFWENELKYSLPTPVPLNYKPVKTGEVVFLPGTIRRATNKPLFLHFFNPACPCSRFNIPHFVSLVKHYSDRIDFAIVVLNADNDYTDKDILDKFGLSLPVFFDKSVAAMCGVYSTPQAVILDTDSKLYYRGNYNKSRYCTLKSSNYAQMALDSLLDKKTNPVFSVAALKSYGCQMPNCHK